jgi:uncharacterized membrane protein
MGLMVLVLGLILFLGPHVLVTMRPQRAAVVKQLGEWPYKGLFAALSIAGLYVTGKGFGMYDTAGPLVLWTPPAWTRHITEALMLPASIFVAAAYLPGRIKLALKHPMLVGVKTWAVAHLPVNGDVGGIILFGSVLAWAVYDRITLKHRSDPGGSVDSPRRIEERHRGRGRRHRPLSRARLRVPSAGGRAARFRHPRIRNLTCRIDPTQDGEARGGAALSAPGTTRNLPRSLANGSYY